MSERDRSTVEVYYCYRCESHYSKPAVPVNCAVNHPPGNCCHHGEKKLSEQDAKLVYLLTGGGE